MKDQEKRKKEFTDIYKNRQKQKKMTPEKYMDLKADGQSDAKIMKAYGFPLNKFNAWKHEHNLIGKHGPVNSQRYVEKPKGEKTMIDAEKEQNAPVDDYKAKYEAMKKQFNDAAKDYSDLKTESLEYRKRIEELESEVKGLGKSVVDAGDIIGRKNDEIARLTNKVSELEESLAASTQAFTATDAQEEIWKLTQQIDRLKNYEADYRSLEVEHRNLRSRFHALEEELEFHRETDRSQLLIMKQYLRLRERVDEVLA